MQGGARCHACCLLKYCGSVSQMCMPQWWNRPWHPCSQMQHDCMMMRLSPGTRPATNHRKGMGSITSIDIARMSSWPCHWPEQRACRMRDSRLKPGKGLQVLVLVLGTGMFAHEQKGVSLESVGCAERRKIVLSHQKQNGRGVSRECHRRDISSLCNLRLAKKPRRICRH